MKPSSQKKQKDSQRKLFKLNIKRVAIVYRIHTPQAVEMAHSISAWLKKKNVSVFTAPDQRLIPGTESAQSPHVLSKMDLLIVLGGDGTYLRAVRMIEDRSIPVLGFNMGSLGFLTSHTSDEVFELVALTLKGKMAIHHRSMVQAEIRKGNKSLALFPALNDVVVERGSHSQLISTSVYSENFLVNQIKADGMIVSTPTGSTAYSLAAGGPILHPDVKAFVVTAVSPHSLTSRPIIFPDDGRLSFQIDNKEANAALIIDGQKVFDLTHEHVVEIRKCEYEHLMVRETSHNFFHLLREKLKFGSRN